jgi:hypothetical protein
MNLDIMTTGACSTVIPPVPATSDIDQYLITVILTIMLTITLATLAISLTDSYRPVPVQRRSRQCLLWPAFDHHNFDHYCFDHYFDHYFDFFLLQAGTCSTEISPVPASSSFDQYLKRASRFAAMPARTW